MSSFNAITAFAPCALLLAASSICPAAHAAPAKHAPHAVVQAARAQSARVAAAALPPAVPALAAPPAPAAPDADAAPVSTSAYTGVVVDARNLPGILRSPAPAIYGANADGTLVYPDRAHVPTPDEVQDESIVRYYHTPEQAAQGVGGSHPLVINALAVLGPAHDALQISAADMQALLDADKSLHFTRSWRVGFLVPAGN